MALITNVNLNKSQSNGPDTWASRWVFELKEIAVQAGWVVKGSSDGGTRTAYDGVTAALPAGEQGSGGDFDAWQTGTGAPFTTAGANPGNPEIDSWCVLECNGHELLIVPVWQNFTNVDGRGRIFYARKGSGGFDGTVAAAGTLPGPPAVATDEWGFAGNTRASVGGNDWFVGALAGTLHFWADDTAVNGVYPLGFLTVNSSGSLESVFAVSPVIDGSEAPADPDPIVFLASQSGPTATSSWVGWNYGTNAFETFGTGTRNAQFFGGAGVVDPSDGCDPYDNIPAIFGTSGNEIYKGSITAKSIAWTASSKNYGDIGEDKVDGRVFAYFGQGAAGGYLFPWPNTSVTPS